MKSKLAIWSLILPIISIVLLVGKAILLDIGETQCGGFYGYKDSTFLCKLSTGNSASWDGVTLFCWFFALLLSLIFGINAIKKIKRTPGLTGKGLAVAGIIFSIVLSLFWFFGIYLFFFGLGNINVGP